MEVEWELGGGRREGDEGGGMGGMERGVGGK